MKELLKLVNIWPSYRQGRNFVSKSGGTNFMMRRGGGPGMGSGEGAVPPPQKIFHYLLSKRRILVDT